MTRRLNPALLALLVASGEFGPMHTPIALQTNPEKSSRLIADEATYRPNAKQRERLGLPKPQRQPVKPHPKRYRRKRAQTT